MEPKRDAKDVFIHLTSGAIAGMVCDLCVHPIDTIRARLQVQQISKVNETHKYRNLFHAWTKIWQTEGPKTFYKGLGIVLFATIPAHAVYFSIYEKMKASLQRNTDPSQKSVWVHFTAGFVAEAFGALIWNPMDVVKQKLQVERKEKQVYVDSWKATKTIYREEGFKGFYRGLWMSILCYGPYVGLNWIFYEKIKFWLAKHKNITPDQLGWEWFLGGSFLSSSIASALTNPLDVVKTRVQIQRGQGLKTSTIFQNMIQHEGWRSFTLGMSARMLWMAPGTAITLLAYEEVKKGMTKLIK